MLVYPDGKKGLPPSVLSFYPRNHPWCVKTTAHIELLHYFQCFAWHKSLPSWARLGNLSADQSLLIFSGFIIKVDQLPLQAWQVYSSEPLSHSSTSIWLDAIPIYALWFPTIYRWGCPAVYLFLCWWKTLGSYWSFSSFRIPTLIFTTSFRP